MTPEPEVPARPSLVPSSRLGAPPVRRPLDRLRDSVGDFFIQMGQITLMAVRAGRAGFQRPFEGREIVRQIEGLGVASTGIVAVTSVFIGMVMAVQFAYGLKQFGGMEYTGRVMALSFARELAPTLTAVIVGGRIGAGMAAEVGSMAVTEQIDAVRALGADPLKKLVWPRLIASIIVMPMLSGFAMVLGFTGAMVVTDMQFHIPSGFFLRSGVNSVWMQDYIQGLIKTPFFGAIIALVGCHFGMNTRGGTAGVGNSTTRTVVVTSIAILIADYFLTATCLIIWPGE
jgi:phospholipid/cholesterol/gamma-HCH transport system permease protein